MILVNPFTGKLVDATDDAVVGQLLGAGFKEQEPEAEAPKKASTTTRSRRSK